MRSDIGLYKQDGDLAVQNLMLSWYGRPGDNLYSRVSVGYLERMYGGVSGEAPTGSTRTCTTSPTLRIWATFLRVHSTESSSSMEMNRSVSGMLPPVRAFIDHCVETLAQRGGRGAR